MPSVVGRAYAGTCRTCELRIRADPMVLAYYLRALGKHPGYDDALKALLAAIQREARQKRA